MKVMFLYKRARPDIEPAIAFLSSRVKEPNKGDWTKLLQVMGFLKGTINDADERRCGQLKHTPIIYVCSPTYRGYKYPEHVQTRSE
jgi:hypothetical protein